MRKAHGLKIRINDGIKWNKIKGNNNMLKGEVELWWHYNFQWAKMDGNDTGKLIRWHHMK